MPSADFCPAVRLPLDSLSRPATQDRSPGVISAAFRAQSPNLRFASLMDTDFAVSCPLVRRSRLISGVCPSTRTFDPRFFQTPPRGDSPCVLTSPSPPSGWAGDLHPQAAERAQHTTKPLRGRLVVDAFFLADSVILLSAKELFTDDSTTTADAGRSADPQLRALDRGMLRPFGRRFRKTLQTFTRPTRLGRNPLLAAILAERQGSKDLFLHSGHLRAPVLFQQHLEPEGRD